MIAFNHCYHDYKIINNFMYLITTMIALILVSSLSLVQKETRVGWMVEELKNQYVILSKNF